MASCVQIPRAIGAFYHVWKWHNVQRARSEIRRCTTHALYRSNLWQQDHCQHTQLCNNGFSEDIVRSVIGDKIAHFHKTKVASAQRCPVYLRLTWLCEISDRFADQISACIRRCYFASNLPVVYRTRTVLPPGRKDVLPHPQHSSALIYSFRCTCGLQYIGRTGQRLDARVKQHVPTKIRLGNYFADHINNMYGSAIAEHLRNNRECTSTYSADLFTILSWSQSDFHFKVFETLYILTHKPSLCKHRECLLDLNVITFLQPHPLSYIFLFLFLFSPYITESISPIFLDRCPSLTVNKWDRNLLVAQFYLLIWINFVCL